MTRPMFYNLKPSDLGITAKRNPFHPHEVECTLELGNYTYFWYETPTVVEEIRKMINHETEWFEDEDGDLDETLEAAAESALDYAHRKRRYDPMTETYTEYVKTPFGWQIDE